VESPVPGDGHAGFGERPGETGQEQSRYRAPGRLNRVNGGTVRRVDAKVPLDQGRWELLNLPSPGSKEHLSSLKGRADVKLAVTCGLCGLEGFVGTG
jgi:hypothetical protein